MEAIKSKVENKANCKCKIDCNCKVNLFIRKAKHKSSQNFSNECSSIFSEDSSASQLDLDSQAATLISAGFTQMEALVQYGAGGPQASVPLLPPPRQAKKVSLADGDSFEMAKLFFSGTPRPWDAYMRHWLQSSLVILFNFK